MFTESEINMLWWNHYKNKEIYESKKDMIINMFHRCGISENTNEPLYVILPSYKPDFVPKDKAILGDVDMVWLKIKKDFFELEIFNKNKDKMNFYSLEQRIEDCEFKKIDLINEEYIYIAENQYPNYVCLDYFIEKCHGLNFALSSLEKEEMYKLRPTFICKRNLAIELKIMLMQIIYGKYFDRYIEIEILINI
jgi:hypothetical protein